MNKPDINGAAAIGYLILGMGLILGGGVNVALGSWKLGALISATGIVSCLRAFDLLHRKEN